MKITKTTIAAASFGAALTSMYSAPELSAQVVDLSFTPSVVPFLTQSSPPEAAGVSGISSNGARLASFGFSNNSFGRTFFGPFSLSNVGRVDPGDVFSTGFISDGLIPFYSSGVFLPSTLTGIETFGFLFSGQAGFFRADFGLQLGDPITLLDGQFNIGGSSITIPEPPSVPEPSSVGLTALALGAVGLRRRRKAAKID